MTDRELAELLATASALEARLRAALQDATARGDVPERDEAIVGSRHVIAFRKTLEGWMGRRAQRAALARP